ncbi:MAG: acetate/propionate family kinase [Rhodospirillales bacterium]|jgi:acetate kinase|nr:acetate/propionate family kinase [Rhodospirillales bacterium]
MTGPLLVINAGSSSLKFETFQVTGAAPRRMLRGQIERLASDAPHFTARGVEGRVVERVLGAGEDPLAALLGWLGEHGGGAPFAVGHRVVHGGARHLGPALIDDALLAELDALVPLAPLHQPHNLDPIRRLRSHAPSLPQVACFDTAFHRGHSEIVDRYALPEALYAQGVRRYGFHGLSYAWIARRFAELAPAQAAGRVIVAHLGSGCSACAMVGGRSVDSTMGFTALEGLVMGTRPGQLDAGVVLYLAEQGMDAKAIEHLLYYESGLKGLSGLSGDVRDLLADGGPRARMALGVFAYRAATAFAALAASMGGLDAVVFTAGIGENAPAIRAAIAERCAWLGLELDPACNATNSTLISATDSKVAGYVIPTDEEATIARETLEVLSAR